MSRVVNKLIELGYSGADIHWFHSFYGTFINIKDPRTPAWRQSEIDTINSNKERSMELMIRNGTKEDIENIINKGKLGFTINNLI